METVDIQEWYTKKAVQALKQEESEIALYLKAMGEKLKALMGEIKNDREQRKQWAACREMGQRRKAELNVTRATKKDTSRGSARPTQPKDAREKGRRHRHNRCGTPGGCGVGGDGHSGERPISPRADRGKRGQLPGRHGIQGVDPGCLDLEVVGSYRR